MMYKKNQTIPKTYPGGVKGDLFSFSYHLSGLVKEPIKNPIITGRIIII